MKKSLRNILCLLLLAFLLPGSAQAVRLKDLTTVRGVRSNQLLGYGLVVGLAGTGDGPSSTMTIQSLAALLAGMGVTLDPAQIKVKNVAAVMVTAQLPPFARVGSRIDVLVSSTGDARSLVGGTLLITPLRAPGGDVYAVAQGPLTVGGYGVSAGGSSRVQNHTTVGRVPAGASVEREVPFTLEGKQALELDLRSPDFTTASRLVKAINDRLKVPAASARDSGTIDLEVPEAFADRVPELVASLEDIDIAVDSAAKVVINERTGTVVMGENVRIGKVAIAHGGLTLQIETVPVISQPGVMASTGNTVVAEQAQVGAVEADKGKEKLQVVEGATIGEVVGALNALGVSPRDLITILQAVRAAGALPAELEIL